ncbi:MAG: DUF2442 domain-containing protein [Vampirovibrionales bacterium]|nr:DUF2442 domain-containing protein [Vampirovibrionales bacterium]
MKKSKPLQSCIIEVNPVREYTLRVRFDDGSTGDVDFSEWQPFPGVLAPLQQPDVFASAAIHPEHKTLFLPLHRTRLTLTPFGFIAKPIALRSLILVDL